MGAKRTLNRRRLLADAGALVVLAPLCGCAPRDQGAVLRALSSQVAVTIAADMLGGSRALQRELAELASRPTASQLELVRERFRTATLAWKRGFALRGEPITQSQAFQRAAFWPARPAAVDAVLRSAEPIDEALVEGLGIDARGLFALEYLLFGPPAATLARDDGERGRAYALELSANVVGFAARVHRLVGDGRELGRSWSKDSARSIERLVVETRDTLEIVRGKLERAERALRDRTPLESAIEGYFSRISVGIAAALIEGCERLYVGAEGGGFTDLVRRVAPEIDEHVRQSFATLGRCLAELPTALEVAVDAHRAAFDRTQRALEALAHVVQVEMVSALET